MEAWILKLGLVKDTEKLRSEVERVEMVVAAVKGRAIGNKPLARSLARLRELLYDTDDAVDELDYHRLQQQIEGVAWNERADGHGAEQVVEGPTGSGNSVMVTSSGSKKRADVWKDFDVTEQGKASIATCIYCNTKLRCPSVNGTSVLYNHLKSGKCKNKRRATDQPPNPSSTADDAENDTPVEIGDSGSRKRMRMYGGSTHGSAGNAHPWNKTEFSNGLQQIIHQLQDIRGAISEVLKLHGSDLVASSNHYRSTSSDVYQKTSSLNQRKMYGRDAEKKSMIELMTKESDGITVLPIVGIGGVGKTALAQVVYNDRAVQSRFIHRIWVWVSNNFDEVRLTREMLDFVSQEGNEVSPQKRYRHEGISSYPKLQEILMSHIKSERFLLILDDVWDDMNTTRWKKLLAPLMSNNAEGNVVVVTTRKLSLAKRIGTVEPIELGSLDKEHLWLLLKSCAFGDKNCEAHGSLSIIGQNIADKLKGNPLAAETAGELLREHSTIDHWNNILKNEDWKSLQLSGGIMPSLKLSYDQLPYHLRQCFLYCSIFPNSYQFVGDELVRIWASQGFLKGSHSNKRSEDIGREYLTDLVNLGFFELFERKESTSVGETCYAMSGLMHDFARLVSRTEYNTMDGLQCNKMAPTIRHLSILTDSSFCKGQDGNIFRNRWFEDTLQSVVISAKKLRTLVLIGQYDRSFFQSFIDVFQKAHKLRVLHISAKSADFNSFLCEMVNHTHLRYIKLGIFGQKYGDLPQVLSKFYHLQVLDVGSHSNPTVPNGINNLVNLRHLVAHKGVCTSVANIGKMTSLQELHCFSVQNLSGYEVTQMKSMNKLTQLGLSQLENVRTRQEVYGANLRDKHHLESLHLSWKDIMSEDVDGIDISSKSEDEDDNISSESEDEDDNISSESEDEDDNISSESSTNIDKEREGLPMSETNSAPSSEQFSHIASEVLDGLEPHNSLKCLQISWYNGTTAPSWLATSLTCLQTLHLENCGEWQTVSLENLLLLRKLVLIKMRNAVQVSFVSPEELVLVKMPNLQRCSCTSMRDLNSTLRVLKIKSCPVLKFFPLFENCQEFTSKRTPWLSRLRELTIHGCPELRVAYPLPPSTTTAKLSIARVSTLPTMKGSCSRRLIIKVNDSDDLQTLDDRILSFHDLSYLTGLKIAGCQNLTSISLKGFSQLRCLKSLEIHNCEKLFSSHDPSELTREDTPAANCNTLPSLECLRIVSCGIIGKWLSLMLRHVQALQEFCLIKCSDITGLSVGEEENSQPNLMPSPEASLTGYSDQYTDSDDSSTMSDRGGLLHIPLNLISSLKKIYIDDCYSLRSKEEGFSGFTSLEELCILGCHELLPFLVHNGEIDDEQLNGRLVLPQSLVELKIGNYSHEMLQPCFPKNLTCLKRLRVSDNPSLKYLQLASCTALKELIISSCGFLERLDSLGRLKVLYTNDLLVDHGEDGTWILPQSLEELKIEYGSHEMLQLCCRDNLTRLKRLKVSYPISLKSLQLQSCTALEELNIETCRWLTALEGLQSLCSLKKLLVSHTRRLECLQLQYCTALEELKIKDCGSLTVLEGLQSLCNLKKLEVSDTTSLECPLLHYCTALEELTIENCGSLTALEGLQSLRSLRCLILSRCPGLPLFLERMSGQVHELLLFPRLEMLHIDDPSVLTTSFCNHLTALQRLEITDTSGSKVTRLTDGQESVLQLLKSLQELQFWGFKNLKDLPAGLHSLASLKRLQIWCCGSISMLPEKGLPPSLEELDIIFCSRELSDQCRTLANKLRVIIDWEYV